MKQFDVKQTRELDGNKFYIRPFPAFISANMSGELSALVVPVLASLAPLVGKGMKLDESSSVMDMDATDIVPLLADSLSTLNGDKLESLLKKLLVKHGNISVELDDGMGGLKEVQKLTEDLANEIFCGDTQDLFILAFDVIKANFSGFFKRLGDRFGGVLNALLEKVTPSSQDTDN